MTQEEWNKLKPGDIVIVNQNALFSTRGVILKIDRLNGSGFMCHTLNNRKISGCKENYHWPMLAVNNYDLYNKYSRYQKLKKVYNENL